MLSQQKDWHTLQECAQVQQEMLGQLLTTTPQQPLSFMFVDLQDRMISMRRSASLTASNHGKIFS